MTDTKETAGQRDRSPAFPVLPLEAALGKLAEFDAHYKRTTGRPEKVGEAWNIKTKSYADRIAAALRYFGLLEYQGSGKDRNIIVSDNGRKYLKAQQDELKREIIKIVALRPKQIAKHWNDWGADRPADAACLDILTGEDFSESGARDFLKVYDATIAYAKLSKFDKVDPKKEGFDDESDEENGENDAGTELGKQQKDPLPSTQRKRKVILMESERELTTGLLSKEASFRLVVTGNIGVKEIERLIKKLELDKEILADPAEYIAFTGLA
jgi:hypothetical protein